MLPSCLRSLFLVVAAAVSLRGADADVSVSTEPSFGPPRGTLLLIGGGSERGAGLLEVFINRAGGSDANFVIVPTGNGNATVEGQLKTYREDDVIAIWRR